METADRENESFCSDDFDHFDECTLSTVRHVEADDHEEGQASVPTESKKSKAKDQKNANKDKKKPKSKVVFNVSDTRYPVVKYVGKKLMGFKLTCEPELEWDLFWTDDAVLPETLARMQPFQKINHFPGMYSLARKNHLGRNLMRMKKAFPKNFKFFPQTFLLPAEYSEFRQQFANKKKAMTFIVKPEASCQGRGIFLTRSPDSVQPGEHYVAQRYLHKPFLLDGLKFDLRIYVLLAGCDPLRIYLYDDGLGRFATEEYIAPTSENMENMCMHLTNYAINKDNPNFVFNEKAEDDNVGHKRSLKAVFKLLEEKGHDVKTLWSEIKKIIIKTFCSVQPILAHNYKSCQPDEPYNNMCFEILGFDIMLDHKLKPWLIEVNHTPSFTTDTPLDKSIKRGVIKDAINIMNVSVNQRIRYKNKKKAELQQRVLTGKKTKVTKEERQAASDKAQKERDEWESKHLGGYEKIFPFDDPSQAEENYQEFIDVAYKWWEQWTGTATKKNVRKPQTAENANQAPPSSSQSTRASQIQSVYSQKMKLGPLNAIKTSQQRSRKVDDTANVNKQNDSLLGKTDITQANKSQEAIQPWGSNNGEVNPLAQYRVVGEDERDSTRNIGTIPEQDSDNEIVGEDEEHDPRALKPLKSTLQIEEVTQPDSTKTTTFRIRKATGTSNKNLPSKGTTGKENSKAPIYDKPPSFPAYQRSPTYSSHGSKTLSRFNDANEDLDKPQERRIPSRLTPKSVPRVPHDSSTLDEQMPYVLEQDNRRIQTSNGNDARKSLSAKKDGHLKAYSKKMTMILANPQKNPVGNYLVPTLFELNIKGSRNNQARSTAPENFLQAKFNVFGKSATKNNQRERSNPPPLCK